MGIPVLDGVASFSAPYDVIICDLWGVVHDGLVAHEDALSVLNHWRAEGKTVILLSNAPRPAAFTAARMAPMGVSPEYYDGIITAGDITLELVSSDKFQRTIGKRVYHLGPALNSPTFEGAGLTEVARVEDAEFVICTAFHNDRAETAEDYRQKLTTHLELDLPHVCANPDFEVGQGDIVTPCAGAIAALYEEMGGEVHWCGKPDPMAYELCMNSIDRARSYKVLAVGDGLRTDIRGANQFGIDSLFISSGIHQAEIVRAGGLDQAFEAYKVMPTAVMDRLKL